MNQEFIKFVEPFVQVGVGIICKVCISFHGCHRSLLDGARLIDVKSKAVVGKWNGSQ